MKGIGINIDPTAPPPTTGGGNGGGAGSGIIGNIGGAIVSSIAGAIAAKKAFKRQRQLLWEERQYNDPSAQMARLKAAGINPHMAYMKGTLNNVVSGGRPVAAAKVGDFNPQIMQNLAMAKQIENLSQSINESKSREDYNRENTNYRREERGLLGERITGQRIDNDIQTVVSQWKNSEMYWTLQNLKAKEANTLQMTKTAKSAYALNMAKTRMEYLKQQEQRVINRWADQRLRQEVRGKKLINDYQQVVNEYAGHGIDFKRDTLVTRQIFEGLKALGYSNHTTTALLVKEGFDYIVNNIMQFIPTKAVGSLAGKIAGKQTVIQSGKTKRGGTRSVRTESYDYYPPGN